LLFRSGLSADVVIKPCFVTGKSGAVAIAVIDVTA